MKTYLLDTSAVLAHFLNEPGGSRVGPLMNEQSAVVLVAAPTWFELAVKLQEKGFKHEERDHVMDAYREVCDETVPADDSAVRNALLLRDAMPSRLPAVDAMIAGCAMAHDAVLVHRDRHMKTIPPDILPTFHLEEEGGIGGGPNVHSVVRERKGVYKSGRKRRRA